MATQMIKGMIMPILLAMAMGRQCRPDKQINDFYAGSASFSISSIQNNTLSFTYNSYNVSLPKPYTKNQTIQYAFAIKDMSVKTSNLYYFDLLVLKTYQSFIILNFIYEPNKWTYVSYNYWISYREDMLMGIETYSIDYIKKIDDQYSINHIIKRKLVEHQDQNRAVSLVYLNGMRFDLNADSSSNEVAHHLHFILKSQKLVNSSLNIQFQCQKTTLLKTISFSYLIYTPQSIDFVSYGGTITYEDFKGSNTNNLKYILPDQHFYSLYGISALTSNKGLKQDGFSLSSELTTSFSFNMAIKQWQLLPFVEMTYIILGKTPASLCRDNLDCKLQEKLYLYGEICVDQCPSNGNMVKYIDGSNECARCPSNTSYNGVTNKCLCNEGLVLSSDNLTCVKVVPVEVTSQASKDVNVVGVANSLSTSITENLGQNNEKLEECFTLVKIQSNPKNIFISLQANSNLKDNLNNLKSNQFKLSFKKQNTKPYNYYCILDTTSSSKYNCLLLYNTAIPTSNFTILIQIKGKSNTSICQSTFEYGNKKQ